MLCAVDICPAWVEFKGNKRRFMTWACLQEQPLIFLWLGLGQSLEWRLWNGSTQRCLMMTTRWSTPSGFNTTACFVSSSWPGASTHALSWNKQRHAPCRSPRLTAIESRLTYILYSAGDYPASSAYFHSACLYSGIELGAKHTASLFWRDISYCSFCSPLQEAFCLLMKQVSVYVCVFTNYYDVKIIFTVYKLLQYVTWFGF